jgi:UPF0755 protein
LEIVKNIVRVLLFVVAIASLTVLAVVGVEFVMGQLNPVDSGVAVEAGEAGGGTRVDASSPEELILSLYLLVRGGDVEQPNSDDASLVNFTIAQGETASMVAQRLQEEGLVRDAGLFRWYMRYHGIDSRLEAGDYRLARNLSISDLADELQYATFDEVTIRIIEGWRAEQVAAMLEEMGLVTSDEFMNVVRNGQFDNPVLSDRPAGASLEGYLFPDTYRVAATANATEIVETILAVTEQRLDSARRAQANSQGLSLFEVLTFASIVEREAVVATERPLVADVYRNRIEQGMYLQADPTVQYALGYQPDSGQWWLLPLPMEALSETISIYNTYLHPGLPPGPICNPGLASIDAVLNPADTEYLFFYSKGDGTHAFATTYEEHLQNQALYQQ